MDYKKKYKEANDKIAARFGTNVAKEIFTDLYESEDERIRKEIEQLIQCMHDADPRKERWIAWLEKQGTSYTKRDVDDAYLKGVCDGKQELEKQGEQKFETKSAEESLDIDSGTWNNIVDECLYGESNSSDKVEPKFHKGDWIVWQDKCYKVNYNGCGYELIDQNGLSTSLEYGTVDKSAHLWTIQDDAKDGDVLHSSSRRLIWIYKDNEHYHTCINMNYVTENIAIDGLIKIPSDVCPATTVQRAILFSKMEGAGYAFDFEKKELKKISQRTISAEAKEALYDKPAEWSEEDESIALGIEQIVNCASLLNIAPDKLNKVRDWLKSLKDRYTWWPSDEQMDALHYVFQHYTPNVSDSLAWDSIKTLELMYQDLKKLREK